MQEHPSSGADAVPPDEIAAFVTRATDRAVAALKPLTGGEANATYRATTDEDETLIVRVQGRGVISFAEEARAMAQGREAGVPVPEVYGMGQVGIGARHDAMVMAVAKGRPLAEVMGSLSRADLARVFVGVWDALRRLHTVRVAHFGWLRREADEGEADSDWVAYAKNLSAFRQKDVPELERVGLTPTEVGGLLRIVSQMRDLPYGQPVLCHGDLGADHLFVGDDLELTGVIDFGMAQGGALALDVGVLRMFHPEVELAWLAEGYGGGPFAAAGFEREVLAQQVNLAMSYLAENLRRGDETYKDVAVMGLRSWLGRWRELRG